MTLLEILRNGRFRIQLAAGIILALIFGPLAYMVTDQTHPYEFDEFESKFVPPVVGGNSKAHVEWRIERNRYCPGVITKQLVDPFTKTIVKSYIPVSTVEQNAQTHKPGWLLPPEFTIPTDVPNGTYGYRSDLCYFCNPLQKYVSAARICYSTPMLIFKVER